MGDFSKHFDLSEFACKDGCGLDNIDPRQAVIGELVRSHEGKAVTPLSGCRCLKHNELVQLQVNPKYMALSSKSRHLPDSNGQCSGVDYPSDDPKKLYNFMDSLFPETFGIGLYSWGIHIDPRHRKARW